MPKGSGVQTSPRTAQTGGRLLHQLLTPGGGHAHTGPCNVDEGPPLPVLPSPPVGRGLGCHPLSSHPSDLKSPPGLHPLTSRTASPTSESHLAGAGLTSPHSHLHSKTKCWTHGKSATRLGSDRDARSQGKPLTPRLETPEEMAGRGTRAVTGVAWTRGGARCRGPVTGNHTSVSVTFRSPQ